MFVIVAIIIEPDLFLILEVGLFARGERVERSFPSVRACGGEATLRTNFQASVGDAFGCAFEPILFLFLMAIPNLIRIRLVVELGHDRGNIGEHGFTSFEGA